MPGLDAEQSEKIGRCAHSAEQRRIIAAGNAERLRMKCGDLLEALILIAQVNEVRRRDRKFRRPGPRLTLRPVGPNHYQSLPLTVRQFAQQHAVNDAENRAVRADAKAECGQGDQREAGPPQQHSRAVTQVLPKCLHNSLLEDRGSRIEDRRWRSSLLDPRSSFTSK